MITDVALDNPKISESRLSESNSIFLAVFPKSGSTYLASLISKLTGFTLRGAVQLSDHNEQDICELRLHYQAGRTAVIQQHAKGTVNNVQLLKKYKIKPVVLLRNIFDVIISNHDHFRLESDKVPMGYIHSEYWSMNETEQLDFIITNMVPWYLNFYVSWRDAAKDIPVHWLTYEQLFDNQTEAVGKIIEFYGLTSMFQPNDIAKAIDSMPKKGDRLTINRLNIGKSGRGEAILSKEQQLMVVAIARKWQLSDGCLEKIGLKSVTTNS